MRIIAKGIKRGEVKASVEADTVATIIICTIEGAIMMSQLSKNPIHLERAIANFPLKPLMAEGYCPIIASSQLEYKKPLRMFDQPTGKMWACQLGRSCCTLQAEIYLDNEVVTTATQVGLFINLATMRPVAIPEKLKAIYHQG